MIAPKNQSFLSFTHTYLSQEDKKKISDQIHIEDLRFWGCNEFFFKRKEQYNQLISTDCTCRRTQRPLKHLPHGNWGTP